MQAVSGNIQSRPSSAIDEEGVRTFRADLPLHRAVDAFRRIMGAEGANLIKLDRDTGDIAVSTREEVDRLPVPRVVRDTLSAGRDFMLAEQQPRWIEGWPDGGSATLLIRIAEHGPRSYALAVRVANVPDARNRVASLVPDLIGLMGFHIEAEARRRAMAEERDAAVQALDHGECGVVAVRADGSIIFANEAARKVFAAEAGLCIRRGTVHPTVYADAIRFQEAVERVIDPPHNERSPLPRAIVMLLTGAKNVRPPVLVIAPARKGADSGGAAAVIYLIQPSGGAPRGLETLCQVHGLSKVETRLMVHLASGMAVAQAAAEMRIKVETARSYLKQIFGKVGVHRQADLMGVMARYGRALRGEFDFQAA